MNKRDYYEVLGVSRTNLALPIRNRYFGTVDCLNLLINKAAQTAERRFFARRRRADAAIRQRIDWFKQTNSVNKCR